MNLDIEEGEAPELVQEVLAQANKGAGQDKIEISPGNISEIKVPITIITGN